MSVKHKAICVTIVDHSHLISVQFNFTNLILSLMLVSAQDFFILNFLLCPSEGLVFPFLSLVITKFVQYEQWSYISFWPSDRICIQWKVYIASKRKMLIVESIIFLPAFYMKFQMYKVFFISLLAPYINIL